MYIVCTAVRHKAKLCYYLPGISSPLYGQSGFLSSCFVCQRLCIFLLVTGGQQLPDGLANSLREIAFRRIQANFVLFKEHFNFTLELFNLYCYNISHKEQLSFGFWCLTASLNHI